MSDSHKIHVQIRSTFLVESYLYKFEFCSSSGLASRTPGSLLRFHYAAAFELAKGTVEKP